MAATATRLDTELMDLERQFWEASKGDREKLRKLCADTFTFTMEDGISSFNKDEFTRMIVDGDMKLTSYQIDDRKAVVRELGPTAAAIAYPVTSEFELAGKREKRNAFMTSVWLKNGNAWQCAFETEAIARPQR